MPLCSRCNTPLLETDRYCPNCGAKVQPRVSASDVVIKKGSWKLYTADEMTLILNGIGFEFIAGYDDLDKQPLREDTRLTRLVYSK